MPPHHDPEAWVTVLRLMSVALSVYFVVLGALLWRWWTTLDMTLRFLLLSLLAMSIVVGWGSLESILRDVPGGSRTIAAAPAQLWAAFGATAAIVRYRKEQHRE